MYDGIEAEDILQKGAVELARMQNNYKLQWEKYMFVEGTWKMLGRPEEGPERRDKEEQEAKCQQILDFEAKEILNSWRQLLLPKSLRR